jgi:hypothetical protein
MKRLLLSATALVALAIAFVGVASPLPANDPPGPPGGWRYEDEPWVVLSVSADGRVLHLQAVGGGCGTDPRTIATETASAVTVHVQQRVAVDAAVGCPAVARIDELRVRLSAPIAGRALIGQSLREAQLRPEQGLRVPRVVGLRAEDAAFALRAQGVRVRGLKHWTVGAQRSSPRRPTWHTHTTVTLMSAESPSAIPPLRPVAFRTVAAGGIRSAFDRRTSLLVRSERRWRALWRQLTAGDEPPRNAPRVDFSREMLLLVTQGRRPEGTDRVRITSIGDTGGSLQVYVTEYESAEECAPTDVHQHPYHVVRLPRSPHRAHVVRFNEPAPCGPTRRWAPGPGRGP